MEEKIDLLKCLEDKIKSGKDVMEKLKNLHQVDGLDKLARKFGQEIKFLEKIRSKKSVKMEHLQSTNLYHLSAIAECVLNCKDLVSVLKPFNHQGSRLEVDVVCHGGSCWVKAIARNAKALSLISRGDGEYGQKSMTLRAKSFLECAKNNEHMYRPPTVVFHFAYGIESPLAMELENLGVIVEGEKLPTSSLEPLRSTWSTVIFPEIRLLIEGLESITASDARD